MIRNICVISPGYPSDEKPYEFTFVDQLMCALSDMGIGVYVITPHDSLKTKDFSTRRWERKTLKGNNVIVFSPPVLTINTRKFGIVNMSLISEKLFNWSVRQTMRKQNIYPDILYAHFLFKSGSCAAKIGKKMGIPSVCAFGESSLWSIREIGLKGARKRLSNLSGVVAVSTNNKNVLLKNRLIEPNKIIVIPNAVNKQVFTPGSKSEARKILNLPQNAMIGIYNGAFSRAKGSLRVDQATKGITGLSMVYLGGGKEEPCGSNILFKGRVAHEHVPMWLRAADFFILPTLEEGCCNAVIEAMSVGLPIITSDKPFNYDILDKKSALLVDPLDVDAIHNAMKRLVQSEELRIQLGDASLKRSANLDINTRAEKILDFLNNISK